LGVVVYICSGVIREFKMIARRTLKNEYSEIINGARAAVGNSRF
jgi:hypothetical protein